MSELTFTQTPLQAADRRDMEVEAGHLVNTLSRGGASPAAAEALIARLDSLRSILATGRYPAKRIVEKSVEAVQ